MKPQEIEQLLASQLGAVEHIADAVATRGVIERAEEEDRFEELRRRKEFRDMIATEIYETYFLPQRHEFDWQLIGQFVDAMCSSPVAAVIAGGVVGNAAYDILKHFLRRTHRLLVARGFAEERSAPYARLAANVEAIERHFSEHGRCARIREIETATDVSREELYPLLRLLGFSHHRRKHNCLWCPRGIKPLAAQGS